MVAAVAQTNGVGSSAGTHNIVMSAYTSGSRLMAFLSARNGHMVGPTGSWTHLGDLSEPTTGDTLCALWSPSAGESTTLAFNMGTTGAGRAWCSEVTGVGDPVDAGTTSNTTTSTGSDTLTRTGVLAGSALLCGVMGSAADAWAGLGWTPSAGWTEVEDSSGGGHPYSWGGYQIAGASGSYSAQPQHGSPGQWSGWFPKGEAMRMVEFPVGGGGGGATARSQVIVTAFKKYLWLPEKSLWRPERKLVLPGLSGAA